MNDPTKKYALTDAGNAERLADSHPGLLHHIHEASGADPATGWIIWDETAGVWKWDQDGGMVRLAIGLARSIQAEGRLALAEAEQLTDSSKRNVTAEAAKALMSWGRRSESARAVSSTLRLAAAMEGITVRQSDFDRHDYLLCVRNGTLDLKSDPPILRPHDPADLITVQVPISYNPGAGCPRWMQFLEEVFPGWDKADLRRYLQALVGYSLTGDTSAQTFHILQGSGANGKSVFISILRGLLGNNYMKEAPQGTFVASKYRNEARYDLAMLKQARVVTTSEVRGDGFLDLTTIKSMSGGDEITCRNLRGAFFSYVPRFKSFLICNAKPKIKEDSQGIWRRVRLIPFSESFEGREDRQLADKLLEELPGILNWALEGLHQLRLHGWQVPEAVRIATEEYREQESPVAQFLTDCYESTGEWQASSWIREHYKNWCEQKGAHPWSDRALTSALAGHGLKTERRGKDRTRGWKIGTPRDDPSALPDISALVDDPGDGA